MAYISGAYVGIVNNCSIRHYTLRPYRLLLHDTWRLHATWVCTGQGCMQHSCNMGGHEDARIHLEICHAALVNPSACDELPGQWRLAIEVFL